MPEILKGDVQRLSNDAINALSERLHEAQYMWRVDGDSIVVVPNDPINKLGSVGEMRKRLVALATDLSLTATFLTALADGLREHSNFEKAVELIRQAQGSE